MQLTKKQLLEHLEKLEKVSLNTVHRKVKHSSLAERFLEDYTNFTGILATIPETQNFKVVRENYKVYVSRRKLKIWFESFTIKLFQDNTDFYIYTIAEYLIK